MMEKDSSKEKNSSAKTKETRRKVSAQENKTQNNDKNLACSPEKHIMEIEINKYKQLVDAINDPKKLAKVIVVITVVVVLIFFGISMISLMLKKFYPYKAISTIQSGATIIENEDTEVIYWLFNSADLWANSGIEVNEGDVITVRASGAFHTAIHHAVDDAKKNTLFRDDWILPMGGRIQYDPSLEKRDSARMKYRIIPHEPDNVLLMQVIPDKYRNKGRDWIKDKDTSYMGFRDGGKNNLEKEPSDVDIIIIGEEKRDIRIPHDGILHFAVNDIVLTERNIHMMMNADIHIGVKKGIFRDTGELELGQFPIPNTKEGLNIVIEYMKDYRYFPGIIRQRYKTPKLGSDIQSLESINEKDTWDKGDTNQLRDIINRNLTELDYYRMYNFVDAWFVDNVGSILIAIERKKK